VQQRPSARLVPCATLFRSLHAAVMDQARSDARGGESGSASVSISGSDRDPGAIEAAIANAERAGVATNVGFERPTISELASMEGPGLLLTNPPYGVRVGEANALRDLYATLARVWRERRPDWRLAMISANPMLEGQMRVEFRERWQTTNGGIAVRLVESVHRDS